MEEFCQYENIYKNSQLKALTDFYSSFFLMLENMDDFDYKIKPKLLQSQLNCERIYHFLEPKENICKNQDIYIRENQLLQIKQFSDLKEFLSNSTNPYNFTKSDDEWEIFIHDPIFWNYKRSNTNNFKENSMNIYGIYECPLVLQFQSLFMKLCAEISNKETQKFKEDLEQLPKKISELQNLITTSFPTQKEHNTFIKDYELFLEIAKSFFIIFKFWETMQKIDKSNLENLESSNASLSSLAEEIRN